MLTVYKPLSGSSTYAWEASGRIFDISFLLPQLVGVMHRAALLA